MKGGRHRKILVRQCNMTRQNVAVRLFAHYKTVPCFLLHRLVATNWLQKGLHRDGLQRGAGDGARTRRSACLEGRRLHSRRSPDIHQPYSRFNTVHVQCERAWQKMSRSFFSPFGKTCHVLLPMISAKDVTHISRQEVTLLNILYLVSSPLALFSRQYVLTMDIDASLEIRYVRKPGKAQAIKIALKILFHQI
jgi:hypothetical protein